MPVAILVCHVDSILLSTLLSCLATCWDLDVQILVMKNLSILLAKLDRGKLVSNIMHIYRFDAYSASETLGDVAVEILCELARLSIYYQKPWMMPLAEMDDIRHDQLHQLVLHISDFIRNNDQNKYETITAKLRAIDIAIS
jgi:hypothetical protein